MPAPDPYSRYVRAMRVLLPAIALGLLTAVVASPFLARDAGTPALAIQDPGLPKDRDGILGARLFGTDAKNRPYRVDAARAIAEDPERARIRLHAPDSSLDLEAGRTVRLTSRHGLYEPATGRLDLEGDVELEDGRGTLVETEAAEADLDAKTARGAVAVRARSPHGTLAGEGFRLDSESGILEVTGRSRLVLTSKP